MSFEVRPIGIVTRPGGESAPGAFFDPDQESIIVIDPVLEAALTGIEEYSHLIVLFWLDRAERPEASPALRRPEGREEMPEVGLFATRSPNRPNPVGMACPRLLPREGNRLVVRGIDAWDQTPVIDIKGYTPRDDIRADATVPAWLNRLWELHDAER